MKRKTAEVKRLENGLKECSNLFEQAKKGRDYWQDRCEKELLPLLIETREALALIERSYPLMGGRMAHQDYALKFVKKIDALIGGPK